MDDAVLLAHIREGNRAAFAALVHRHAETAYRIAYRMVANRAAAEDIVQDAFLKLWATPGLWQEGRGAQFTTWFTRIVINRSLDWQRKKKPIWSESALDVIDPTCGADEQLILNERQRKLEQAIVKLPARQRVALTLCFYEELSNKDAAAVMQLPVKALQSLVMRAKAGLKTMLGESDG